MESTDNGNNEQTAHGDDEQAGSCQRATDSATSTCEQDADACADKRHD